LKREEDKGPANVRPLGKGEKQGLAQWHLGDNVPQPTRGRLRGMGNLRFDIQREEEKKTFGDDLVAARRVSAPRDKSRMTGKYRSSGRDPSGTLRKQKKKRQTHRFT